MLISTVHILLFLGTSERIEYIRNLLLTGTSAVIDFNNLMRVPPELEALSPDLRLCATREEAEHLQREGERDEDTPDSTKVHALTYAEHDRLRRTFGTTTTEHWPSWEWDSCLAGLLPHLLAGGEHYLLLSFEFPNIRSPHIFLSALQELQQTCGLCYYDCHAISTHFPLRQRLSGNDESLELYAGTLSTLQAALMRLREKDDGVMPSVEELFAYAREHPERSITWIG